MYVIQFRLGSTTQVVSNIHRIILVLCLLFLLIPTAQAKCIYTTTLTGSQEFASLTAAESAMRATSEEASYLRPRLNPPEPFCNNPLAPTRLYIVRYAIEELEHSKSYHVMHGQDFSIPGSLPLASEGEIQAAAEELLDGYLPNIPDACKRLTPGQFDTISWRWDSSGRPPQNRAHFDVGVRMQRREGAYLPNPAGCENTPWSFPDAIGFAFASAMKRSFCPAVLWAGRDNEENLCYIPRTLFYAGINAFDKEVGDKEKGGDNCNDVGNPCSPSSGNKYQAETDFKSPTGLEFTRHYNSLETFERGLPSSIINRELGRGWTTVVDTTRIEALEIGDNEFTLRRPNGRGERWVKINGVWVGDPDTKLRITEDTTNSDIWVTVTFPNGDTENYDIYGNILSEVTASGLTTTYTREWNSPSRKWITGPFGHTLSFVRGVGTNHIETMTDPEGNVYRYQYDANDNLTTVIYPDDTPGDDTDNPRRIYHYEDSYFTHFLTGITDENGVRFATFEYFEDGNVRLSEHAQTVNAGPQERFVLSYDSNTQTTVSDAEDAIEVFTFEENLGVKNVVSRVKQSDGKGVSQAFDVNNNLEQRTDEEGRVTKYTYNATNQRETMTEAFGTQWERTTTYEYVSPDVDLVKKVTTTSVAPGLNKDVVTAYTPDGKLNVESIAVNGHRPDGTPVSRTTTFQYNDFGQVIEIDGPRTDVSDTTTLAYYECTTGQECGQLQLVTNALGHQTTYDLYDANGRVKQKTDPLGVVTTYNYDPRGRLLQVVETPPAGQGAVRTTIYTYYEVMDQVHTVTTPDGVTLTYTYDAAHDLQSISDNAGNTIEYTYDQKGNRIREDTKDPGGTLVRRVQTAYDLRNRIESIDAAGSLTQMIRDAVGNLIQETDPNFNPPTTHTYDALDRLDDTLDALGNLTDYDYGAQDNLIRVQAPNNATTTYEYDDLGNLLKEISPDRGTTTYTYDAAGNVETITDARNVSVTYSYDALNRITFVDYPGTAEDITLTYETCPNGLGRVCDVQDESGYTQYAYNAYGQVTTETRTVLGVSYVTQYYYSPGGQLGQVFDPSNEWVYYQRDAIGRVVRIFGSGPPNTLVMSNATYRADGLLTGQTFSNGLQETRDYDLQGRLLTQSLDSDTRSYGYDANGNVLNIDTAPWSSDYIYDTLDRLDNEMADHVYSPTYTYTTSRDYGYDPNGNRETRTVNGGSPGNYAYAPDSNRLTDFEGWQVYVEANGHQSSHFLPFTGGGMYYIYPQNKAGRVMYAGQYIYWTGGYNWNQTDYTYNARGLRTTKTLNAASATPQTIVYHYDLDGHLILETTDTGEPIRSYAWLGDTPILQRDHTGATDVIMYLHADHLNTPRLASDIDGNIVWQWYSDAFGGGSPTAYPVGDGQIAQINLRFPGQYFDAETGLHYNWNRYYDPKTGRYITSDPIGLEGGLNTYSYVDANPLANIDIEGLERKPGKTPPNSWPQLPDNVGGKKPKWDSGGYYKGKKGRRLTWDDRSHGTGVDRGRGPQDGHWDDETSNNRWDRYGNPLPGSDESESNSQYCPPENPLPPPIIIPPLPGGGGGSGSNCSKDPDPWSCSPVPELLM